MEPKFFHLEVRLQPQSKRSISEIKELVKKCVQELKKNKGKVFEFFNHGDYQLNTLDSEVQEDIRSLTVSFYGSPLFLPFNASLKDVDNWHANFENADYILHTFKMQENFSTEGDDEEINVPSSFHMDLPSVRLDGLWETLLFENQVKNRLLKFVTTALFFSEKKISTNCINFNRVVLLHGPPGTGKTSLCKALAQKLSIRLQKKYDRIQLIEINAHSLFSKYFSESGKLVLKLFERIFDFLNDNKNFAFILIDEVESLVHTRERSATGSDPSDALRVVNALLTQIDVIKNYPNVIIFATSNITKVMDVAFLDRADIKQFIGLPSVAVAYEIYKSCINELMKKGIITQSDSLLPLSQLELALSFPDDRFKDTSTLHQIASSSAGFSGRTLRKIPFLAISLLSSFDVVHDLNLKSFLSYMKQAVEQQLRDIKEI